VIGHNWPVWYRFQGGMGLATGMGAVGSLYPLAVLVAAGLLGLLRFTVIRHTPRATVAASLCLPVVLYFLQTRAEVFWLGTGISLLVALRHLSDWNRAYE
jgi:glycerol-3-phosphate acyltransferase PlsY